MSTSESKNSSTDEALNQTDASSFDRAESHPSMMDSAMNDVMAEEATGGAQMSNIEQQLQEARDRELKAQAELENFRKRLARDFESQLKYASLPLLRDLLDVIDNLNRALGVTDASPSVQALLDGVKMVQGQLETVMLKYHCKPIPAVGAPFDPNFHQAVTQAPSDTIPAGNVVQEVSVGYTMHDRVIRPSMVIVSTGSA